MDIPDLKSKNTVKVAQDLIGCFLVRKQNGKVKKHRITETEAYDGHNDLASHASKGKTARTEIMFMEGGRFYIYLVYGLHWMLNIVTGPKDYPAAVLIRGVEGINGPARVTKSLKINKSLNGKLCSKSTGLWIEPRKKAIPNSRIQKSARVGVNYAGPIWSKKEYRFSLKSD